MLAVGLTEYSGREQNFHIIQVGRENHQNLSTRFKPHVRCTQLNVTTDIYSYQDFRLCNNHNRHCVELVNPNGNLSLSPKGK